MLILIIVGLAAGLITSISPCVLPVLPVVLAASADRTRVPAPAGQVEPAPSRRWRPYGVVAGLVISFSVSTLFGSLLLSALGLPQDLLRDAGIAVLAVIGLSLLVPQLGELLERPFARLPQRNVNPDSNGLVLGLGLGLLFVPCAGPVLATIAVLGASHHIGFSAVILTLAFGVGAGVPLLVLALAGDALARRTGILRRRARAVRLTSGLVMVLIAALIGFNLTDGLQRHVPGYTTALQKSVEQNNTAAARLRQLTTKQSKAPGAQAAAGNGASTPDAGGEGACSEGGDTLENCGPAPELTKINGWLNTPDGGALSLAGLRGKVVLIDFWTYSCINCQRTLPHVEAWYSAYAKDGLEVIGVHTPEFAFEHVTSNIRDQAAALGVKYPIAIDNGYGTWNAYGNQYWPAEYLIDATGVIRHVSFGEGDYASTESQIRQLLTAAKPGVSLGQASDVPNATPTEQQTPETYLGYNYRQKVTGPPLIKDSTRFYTFAAKLSSDTFDLAGTWTDGDEALTAGADAQLKLSYQAKYAYLVLGGTGSVTVAINGVHTMTVQVSGAPKLYTLASRGSADRVTLTLGASKGVQAYDFTFG